MEQSPEKNVSHLSKALITAFTQPSTEHHEKKIIVNPVVSRIAAWYEKLRNAMDYKEEEVILRAAIERILRRRSMFGDKKIAEPMVRELLWARYFPNNSLPESLIPKIAEKIEVYKQFKQQIQVQKVVSESVLTDLFYHLLSSDIEHLINPNHQKELMVNYIFRIMKENITITDEQEQTRDAQVYIAVRSSFAKNDLAFLQYYLFTQILGELTPHTLAHVVEHFKEGYMEMNKQLNYPFRNKIYSYVRRRTAVFFIMDDLLRSRGAGFKELVTKEEEFKQAVVDACNNRYAGIRSKVTTAIIRSVVFVLVTKALFAYLIEGTYERVLYGEVQWGTLLLNTGIPPILLLIVGFFIRAPGQTNTDRIFQYMKSVLFDEKPRMGNALNLSIKKDKEYSLMENIFTGLWFLAFFISFGLLIFILTKIGFQWVSQVVFLFFLAIISFLAYRIALIPQTYTVEDAQGFLTPIVDFLFLPVIRVGRRLTEGISQINVILLVFDFLIEAPFKGLFAFFDQWFLFLHAKREDLG